MANRVTTVFEIVADKAAKNLSELQKQLGRTDISAQDLAQALRRAADDAERELDQIGRASDAMSGALSDDFKQASERAGVSVDDMVVQLHSLGVSFDDIEANAKDLGAALERLDSVNPRVTALGDEADVAAKKLGHAREAGDQTGSVLANMVGNSVQDLGALGGVAGTAGMALGQLAEYATEGNVSVGSLAKFAGPMVGVGVAVTAVSWAMGKLREESQKAKEEAAAMLEVQKQIKAGKFAEAGEKLADSYGELVGQLEKMGVPQDEVMRFILGSTRQMPTFNRLLEENKVHFEEGGVGLTDFGGKLNSLAGDVYDARDAFSTQADQLAATDQAAQAFTAALVANSAALAANTTAGGDTRSAAEKTGTAFHGMSKDAWDAATATDAARLATQRMNDAASDLLGTLDQEERWKAWQTAVWNLADGAGDAGDDTREWKRQTTELVTALDGMPEEQRTKILAQVEQGDVDTVNAILFQWSQGINVPVRFRGQGNVGFDRSDLDRVEGAGATGAIVNRPTIALVGERGPEALVPLDRTRGNSPLAFGAAGGDTIVVNIDARGAVGLNGPQIEQWVHEMWTTARRKRGKST